MSEYLKALREFNGYKLYDNQLEEEVSKLNIAVQVGTGYFHIGLQKKILMM